MKCMKRQKIMMFDDISKFYFFDFENKQSLTIFENINVVEEYFFSSMLIIQNQKSMKT